MVKLQWSQVGAWALLALLLSPMTLRPALAQTPIFTSTPTVAAADGDADGIVDAQDRCPMTAAGAAVDEFGCADQDGDGVIDPVDACPDSPTGVQVDTRGCADSDRDGVINQRDRCPGTHRDEQVTASGCAARQLAKLQSVYFSSDSVELSESALVRIADIARVMTGVQGLYLDVQGHSDSLGDAGYNLRLSRRRAEAVQHALVEAGLPPAQIRVSVFGEAAPMADNDTAQGRMKNRRVSFRIKRSPSS